jgi:phytoene synthase
MRQHGRTFYFASRCLPPERRRAVLATYAFCRVADDIVDEAETTGPEAVATALERWKEQIDRPEHPVAVAFAATRERYSIPIRPVHDLLTGIQMDLTANRYGSWSELRTYCYHVAGTVGLMVAPILGCREQSALQHAAGLGIAMQLTNILRDVAEDARLGRLYLPLDEIAAFGCDPDAILAGRPGPGFPALIAFQIERARALYADAHCGVGSLIPRGRFTTLAASRLYAGILTEIEAINYDVFSTRAHVSTARKIRALPGVAAAFVRHSLESGRGGHCRSVCRDDHLGDSIISPPWSESQSYG